MPRVAAVDLGASSGRVGVVEVGQTTLRARCVHRFPTAPVPLGGRLVWDVVRIQAEIEAGLALAGADGPVDAVGVDAWGCDYGLVGPAGDLVGLPLCYRDARTLRPGADGLSAVDRVHAAVDHQNLYAATGTQFQPFDTLYQLVDDARCGRLRPGVVALLVPELIVFWLTGRMVAETTDLSTTGLVDPRRRRLADGLREPLDAAVGNPRVWSRLWRHWARPVEPGTVVGPLLDAVAERAGLRPGTPVVAVASHDTASAVVAVPATLDQAWAYVVSGTWSLVGLESAEPVVTPAARQANFTNELGAADTVRFLRNVTGLWLLNQCLRAWQTADPSLALAEVVAAAAREPSVGCFDVDDPALAAPTLAASGLDLPGRVAALLGRDDLTPAGVTRAILDSLAQAYAAGVADAERLTGRRVGVVHLVGGGSRDPLLGQATADATGRPVVAGPVEASLLGNALVQAWALGWRPDLPRDSRGSVSRAGLAAMRDLVARTQPLVRHEPRKGTIP